MPPRLAPGERLARDLDWNLLRVFLALAESGSVTAAAQALGLKQPSVSAALKRLETRLGQHLIDRGPNRFALTPAGTRLRAEAHEIRAALHRLPDALLDAAAEVSGPVTIALASHVASPMFDALLASFFAAHARASLSLQVAPSRDVVAAVAGKRASFGICLLSGPPPDLETAVLYREYFGLFCGPTHPMFGRSDIGLADLAGLPAVSFVTDRIGDALQPVAELRARAGISARTVGTSSHLEEVRRMIIAGLGIGPLPLHVVAGDVAQGRLWRLPPPDAPAVDVHLVWSPRARPNRAEAAFLSDLRTAIAATPIEARTYDE